ncbi:MAG TPA: thioredoxin family protein [Solirubrobacterales bacterium]|nr:thioredoxin family protein [Solirubrobacterales bacterium]
MIGLPTRTAVLPLPPKQIFFLALLAFAGLGMLISGCGSSDSGDEVARSAPSASDFPSAEGKTIEQLLNDQTPSDKVVAPAAVVFEPGKNRFPFGVFNVDRSQVEDADVALYFAKSPQSPVEGPFPAEVVSLETKPAYRSKGAGGPGEANSFYLANVKFDRAGPWLGLAILKVDGDTEAARITPSPVVSQYPNVAKVGQKAPKVSTPTASDVGGDLSKIDTRQPPSSMHTEDLKDVLGKKPVVLVFATPALCQSRVCGPVVDVAEQVKDEVGDGVVFIHNEVYNDNDPSKGIRPQLTAFGLQTEPWIFLINKDGTIEKRIEGAIGVDELKADVEQLKKKNGL